MTYVWNIKYDTNRFACETETYSQTQKANLQLPKRKEGMGGINEEFRINKLLYT